jgi:hypothetical protein
MRDEAGIQHTGCTGVGEEADPDLLSQILRVQERIIMTDGYGPPAMLVFWLGVAAFYTSRIRRACPPGLIAPHAAILTRACRRRQPSGANEQDPSLCLETVPGAGYR